MNKYLTYLKQTKVQILIIVILTLLSYSNIFQNEFVIDDKTFVTWAQTKSLGNIFSILGGDVPIGHEGVYRPIRGVIYVLYANIFGLTAFIYHLHGIVLHFVCTLLIYLIASKISKNYLIGFGTGLIFGVHPIHTETITYIAASMEATGLAFMLGSFYLYILSTSRFSFDKLRITRRILFERSRELPLYIGSIVSAILGFFTYEMTLTLPLIIVFFDFCFKKISLKNWRIKFKEYLPYFAGLFFYIVVRFLSTGIEGRAPYPGDSFYITFLTVVEVFIEYLKLIIFPINQAVNHVLPNGLEAAIYRGYNLSLFKQLNLLRFDVLIYLFILIGIVILGVGKVRKFPIVSFGIGLFFITLLPASEIIPQGSVMNEKLLYIPSFGIILLLVWVISRLIKQKVLFLGIILVISLILGILTHHRNKNWKDEITIWTKDIKIYTNTNAYAYFQLGNAYRQKGEFELAITNYEKSYQINPNFSVAFASRAQIFDLAGYEDEAIRLYRELLSKDPYFWEAYRELGKIYLKQEKFDLAADEFKKLLLIYPTNLEAEQLYLIAGRLKEESKKDNE